MYTLEQVLYTEIKFEINVLCNFGIPVIITKGSLKRNLLLKVNKTIALLSC